MKILILSLFLVINSIQFSFAQPPSNEINQIFIYTEREDGNVILHWESNREVNSSYYIIEKSTDGEKFKILTTLKAGSSTYQKTNYSFVDVSFHSRAQYRVTLVLMDGKNLVSLTESTIKENVAKAIVK